jgi:hypothetical protein
LSEASGLCHTDHNKIGQNEYWTKYNLILTKLSGLVDEGRLIIPNLNLTDNSAYGGRRQAALDCIVTGYKIAKCIDFEKSANNKEPVNDLTNAQLMAMKKALLKLPDKDSVLKREKADYFKGWSCNSALVEAKRQFVNEISKLIQARQWANDIKQLIKK